MQYSAQVEKPKYLFKLYGVFLLFKFALEYVYVRYSSFDYPVHFAMNFNPVKYIYGILWFSLLFFMIQNGKKQASTFFLQFILVFQILPITVIYEMKNESSVYYSFVCIAMAICEWMVSHLRDIQFNLKFLYINQGRIILFFCVFGCAFFAFYIYQNNGFPSLMALNIFDVYKLRNSGMYQLGKFASYLQATLISVVIPVLLTRFIITRKYLWALFIYGFEFLIYLYSGQKTFLFYGFMIAGVLLMARKDSFPFHFWFYYCSLASIICLCVNEVYLTFGFLTRDVFKVLYSLFISRVLLTTAVNSFYYYDFFSLHPKVGFDGMFPRWLIPIESTYGNGEILPVPKLIGHIYYNSETWANNGFIAEGFERFDFLGMLIIFVIFSLLLKMIDNFQKKTSYDFAIGCSICIVFGLGDGQLLGPMFFGYIGVWILFLVLYRPDFDREVKLGNK